MTRTKEARQSLFTGFLIALVVMACGDPEAVEGDFGESAEKPPLRGLLLSEASWLLTWDRSGVELHPGGGFSLKTDEDYHITIKSGWIVDYSASLGTCTEENGDEDEDEDEDEGDDNAGDEGLSVDAWAAMRLAKAPEMRVEDLSCPVNLALGSATFPAFRFCFAHWLVARPVTEAEALHGADPTSTSIHVVGTWQRAGVTQDFSIETWWPEGRLDDLAPLVVNASELNSVPSGAQKAQRAEITIIRKLDGLFDGIDFSAASNDVIAYQVLKNLVLGAKVVVVLND